MVTGDGGLVMIRVLGPVDLVTDEGTVTVNSRLERKLLGALALSGNHLVSTDQLADILWGDEPPSSRDNTLQTYICRLRRAIGPGRIISADHSYELQLAIDELDAMAFEKLVGEAQAARGDPERVSELCRAGLALWRGTPFGEFADEDPFRLEAIRLDELRVLVMELELESESALGRAEGVVARLRGLVEEYPYRERLWYLLAAALSVCGRRVEALRACQELRRVLSEVGLQPSAEMRQLEDQILLEAPQVRPRLH
jgi:DNA-binding SARP family transcriptional activator